MSVTNRLNERTRRSRGLKNRGFLALCIFATSVSVLALAVLLVAIVNQGRHYLWGMDWQEAEADRAPREPIELFELADVDWDAAAVEHDAAALRLLANVDWSGVFEEQGLEFVDELPSLDWSRLAEDQDLDGVASLAVVDWADVYPALRVPGDGWARSVFNNSDFGGFVTSPPSRKPEKAGIGPALAGTFWICAVCAFAALPLGVGTAIFLEEYKPRHRGLKAIHGFVQLNITNLAGVPSIVYGIIGLTTFVQMFGAFGNLSEPSVTLGAADDWYYMQIPFGRGVFAGGLTLMLVILPIIIISSQEALRAVPDSLRQGALSLGSTRWQMIRQMTLPCAVPGIMTGSILAMSRAIGEAAPVLIICGIVFIRFTPEHLMDEFTALPLQIYDWAGRPQEAFHEVAASGIMILLGALLTFNAMAIVVRQKFQRPLQ